MNVSMNRRMLPLHIAVFLQGFALWVPVEKLFMNEIGFDAASVGLMAAAYAALVPIVEIPAGILADRWSRRGVLVLASVAALGSVVMGGFSNSVPAYIVAMLFVGAYFALYTGTMDAIVYDTVLAETGNSALFERTIGRVRFIESVALVSSALLGGWLAGLTSTRLMFFLTIPPVALSIVFYLRFTEPRLHKSGSAESLRGHLALTYRTLTRSARLLPIVLLALLSSVLLNTIFEFGPLWLVALAVPAVLYGPYWAGLMSTFGLGGLLAGRLALHRPVPLAATLAVLLLSGVTLSLSTSVAAVMVAQIMLALLLAVAGILVSKRLHDSVPSTIRSGVASGVSSLSWMAFLPFALVFGLVTKDRGVHDAGWMLVGVTVLAGLLLIKVARDRPAAGPAAITPAAPSEPIRTMAA